MKLFRNKLRVIALYICSVGCLTPATYATEGMTWQFRADNSPNNPGFRNTSLTYGLPETDNTQVSGSCSEAAGAYPKSSIVIFGADTGELPENQEVDLRLSGGGNEYTLNGSVFGTKAETGITGVYVVVANNDPIWKALTSKTALDYQIPGYRSSTLQLSSGHSAISDFITTCRSYFTADSGNTDTTKTSSGISEREAFQSAKELGSIEAWQAFLNNFPTGFHADMAHAYIKKLQDSSAATPQVQPTVTPQSPAQVYQQTINLGPGRSAWYNKQHELDEGNSSVYAAAVESNGIEFVTYCNSSKQMEAVFYESRRGVYPDFDGRITQGLAAERQRKRFSDPNNAHLPIRFSNGNEYFWIANQSGLTGEVFFKDALRPNGRLIADMMALNTMTISAPPFSATFQLRGSRAAICSVIKRCGVSLPGCGSYGAYKSNRPRCPKYAHWSNRYKTCICPGDSVYKNGRCIKENEPPRKPANNNKNSQKAACAVAQIACAAGSRDACNAFNKNCR